MTLVRTVGHAARRAAVIGFVILSCLPLCACAPMDAVVPPSAEDVMTRAASAPMDASFEFETASLAGDPSGRWTGEGYLSGEDFVATVFYDGGAREVEKRKIGESLYAGLDGSWSTVRARPGIVGTGFVAPNAHLELLDSAIPEGEVRSETFEDVPCHRVAFRYDASDYNQLFFGLGDLPDAPEFEGFIGKGEVWVGAEDGRVRQLVLRSTWDDDLVFESEYVFRDFGQERSIETPEGFADTE